MIRNLSDDDDDDDSEKILDDEVRIAPWTLTRAFTNALHGTYLGIISGFIELLSGSLDIISRGYILQQKLARRSHQKNCFKLLGVY